MISDNGSTFKAASKVIENITTNPAVSKHAAIGIEWYYNLEKAPWWGGLFERLRGVSGKQLEELNSDMMNY